MIPALSIPDCSLCSYRSRMVPGQGPAPCRYLFIGEGPGRQEHAKGIPFCGESGWELDGLYLPLAGLSRSEIHITNAMKCRQGEDNPTDTQAAYCARHHIAHEIRAVQPEVIVTLGAIAVRVLFPDCNLSLEHGMPRQAVMNPEIADWKGLHIPMYHPAIGIRDSHWMIELTEDFRRLKIILRQGWAGPVDEHPNPDYIEVKPGRSDGPINFFVLTDRGDEIAVDTEVESLETMKPWCWSYSGGAGAGAVLMAGAGFRTKLSGLVTLHNALFDLPVLGDLDVDLSRTRIIDTMSMAYHQGVPPWGLGLKTLAWRLCGMRMVEFSELVRPGSIAALRSFLEVCDDRIGSRDPVRRRLNRLISDLDNGRAGDPWQRIKGWPFEHRLALERAVQSKIPVPSIIHVPRSEAIWYAARDPDATLRVYHALRRHAGDKLGSLNWGRARG